jgi:CAAX protease family protein
VNSGAPAMNLSLREMTVAIVFAAIWAASYRRYANAPGMHPVVALASLLVFVLALSIAALAFTQSLQRQSVKVCCANRAILTALLYFAFLLICVWGVLLNLVQGLPVGDRTRSVLLAVIKVITMIAVPLGIMRIQAIRLPTPQRGLRLYIVAAAMVAVALLAIIGLTPSLAEIQNSRLTPLELVAIITACFLWVVVNAALPEGVLFRACLQSTLAVRFRSEVAGAFGATMIFAVAHIPGLYFRADQSAALGTSSPTIWLCTAYAIAVLSPIGLLFSVLWTRTRC